MIDTPEHHVEFSWREDGRLQATCRDCGIYFCSYPVDREWYTIRRTQQQLARLFFVECARERTIAPVIVGGDVR